MGPSPWAAWQCSSQSCRARALSPTEEPWWSESFTGPVRLASIAEKIAARKRSWAYFASQAAGPQRFAGDPQRLKPVTPGVPIALSLRMITPWHARTAPAAAARSPAGR